MTAKILKSNGQVQYFSSHRCLTDLEYQDPDLKNQRDLFTIDLSAKLGGPVDPADLAQLDPSAVTPENELYEDDDGDVQKHVPDIDLVTPEMQDGYVGAEVNLPYQGILRAGKVKRWARNEDGELEGVANANLILDTRAYQVEFDDG
jgi:hypothetical protein